MNTRGEFVLGVVVGAIMIAGIVTTCSERVTMGKAEALVQNNYGDEFDDKPAKEARDTPTDECVTGTPCVLWKQDWHAQRQRTNGTMTTVEIFGWRCIGWENTPGYYPATEPFCRNQVRGAGR